jgi:hypothetical protein
VPAIIVVFNGADPDQVAWFESTPYLTDQRTKILLSDGSYYDLNIRFKRPVYYLFEKHAERLQVENVPAVIVQKNNMLEVTEFYVEPGFAKMKEKEAEHAKTN